MPGVVQRVHPTPTEWREILAGHRASAQSKTKFFEQNVIARSKLILREWRLAAGEGGSKPASPDEWFVDVEDDGDEAPPPRGSGLFAEVTDTRALVTDPKSRRDLEEGRNCLRLPDLRARQPGEGEWELETGLVSTGRIPLGTGSADHAGPG